MNDDFLLLFIKAGQLREAMSKEADLLPSPNFDYASHVKNITAQMQRLRPQGAARAVQAVDPTANNGRFYLPAAGPAKPPMQLPSLGLPSAASVQSAANPVMTAIQSNADRLNVGLLRRVGQGLGQGYNFLWNRWKGKS